MNGKRSARSGDSRTRSKPPKSNTGALCANVSLRCFVRLCRPSVVGSTRYSLQAVNMGVLVSEH